jgi:RNA polymerase sigma-70 factor, ECF subfamily
VISSPKSISQLLIKWRDGDEKALDELTPLVYAELHRMAHRYMRGERRGHSLQTTDLVNEFWLKVPELQLISWRDRRHFYAVVGLAMRRILVDHARKNLAGKRKGERIDIDHADPIVAPPRPEQVIALEEAISELAKNDPRKAEIVVLKHFVGLTDQETSQVLGISTATVNREWKSAKLWLLRTLTTQAK